MTSIEDPVATGIEALSRFFVGEGSLEQILTRVAELARDSLGADMAGITMIVDGRPRTGVFTDPTAASVDRWQYESPGRGPCIDAFREQRAFHIVDTAAETRWPEFAQGAESFGIRSTLSLPLTRTGEPLGAMNLYSRRAEHFGVDTASAELLSAQAGIVLANAAVYHDSRILSENLNQALTSRRTIDYAIGLLMSVGGRSPDDAFQILVRASQRENRKLRDIAADIVDAAVSRTAPGPERSATS